MRAARQALDFEEFGHLWAFLHSDHQVGHSSSNLPRPPRAASHRMLPVMPSIALNNHSTTPCASHVRKCGFLGHTFTT
jgi:hypothetical protein